jgi:hypothetical protein
MNMLWIFRLSRLEQEESGHPELGHHIATGSIIDKPEDDALATSINRLQSDVSIPRQGGVPFSNNILTSNPHIGQLRSEEARTELSSDDFCFWKLRHTHPG